MNAVVRIGVGQDQLAAQFRHGEAAGGGDVEAGAVPDRVGRQVPWVAPLIAGAEDEVRLIAAPIGQHIPAIGDGLRRTPPAGDIETASKARSGFIIAFIHRTAVRPGKIKPLVCGCQAHIAGGCAGAARCK